MTKKVFLAPDVLVAFIDRANPKHLHAAAFFRYFAQEHYKLFTTVSVINTTYDTLSVHISPSVARDFIKALALGSINVISPDETDMKLTFKTILTAGTPEISFNEVLMQVIANRRSITQVCTFSYLHPLFRLMPFYLPI